MDYQWLVDIAINAACQSTYRIRMGAVIFKGRRVISIGVNHPLRSARHLHPRFQEWRGSIHAEVDAILRAKTDLRRCSMLVVRVNRLGELKTSTPCDRCFLYITTVGIRKVYHVNGNNHDLEETIL